MALGREKGAKYIVDTAVLGWMLEVCMLEREKL